MLLKKALRKKDPEVHPPTYVSLDIDNGRKIGVLTEILFHQLPEREGSVSKYTTHSLSQSAGYVQILLIVISLLTVLATFCVHLVLSVPQVVNLDSILLIFR